MFRKAIKANPECADAYSDLGVIALSEDNVNESLGLFKRALEIEPLHRDALPNYLTVTIALGAFEEAISLLQCYTDKIHDNPDLTYQLAYCHMKLGHQREACSLLEKVLENNPGHEEAMALLAECRIS
jgi:tetratricopeptide (TPR) repeat protein